ncbi:hypothetical protein J40TS1_03820 [Paenibacillus montaniterrae]|uniref:Uncharacterized protein n=1 Tax=Paenibacillus montaniterrae TaxID=429341 RepID=A0A919YK90_9BACL|nr:hypothetical protein J40TS1_03820 [Paenibacillus montaniterrae]
MARVEGDVAFTTLLNRLLELKLAIPEEEVNWHFSLFSQG